MSISDDERQTLHTILDALINSRNSLERIDPSTLHSEMQYYQAWSRPRRDLALQASRFVRRILGPRLHRAELEALFDTELQENCQDSELMDTLSKSLRSFLPLFIEDGGDEHFSSDETIVRIIDDFLGIHWGDEPRFFKIRPRRQGQHKRLYRLNRLRLTALEWDSYLKAAGMGAHERHRIISDAYRTEWGAITKWPQLAKGQYGFRSNPDIDPEWARRDYQHNQERVHEAIKRDGEAYWLEKSAGGTEN